METPTEPGSTPAPEDDAPVPATPGEGESKPETDEPGDKPAETASSPTD